MGGPVFIIAEAGVNHDGVVADALKMVDVAADAGADAIKFQSFIASATLTDRAVMAEYQTANTGMHGTQLELVRSLELDRDAHFAIAERCAERGIEFMSTAFDAYSLDLLLEVGVKRLKIASGELTWSEMLIRQARTGLPLIVSTGMATQDEVREALGSLAYGMSRSEPPASRAAADAWDDPDARRRAQERCTLLHCTTQYPAPPEAVNLMAMANMGRTFGLPIGYSDHSLGLTVPIAATALGATVIEKHFTLSRSRSGPDHAASLEPHELAAMVAAVREVSLALGDGIKKPAAVEQANRVVARRSLVAARPIAEDEALTDDAVVAKRPADGASPMAWWDMRGRRARRAYAPDEAIDVEEAAP